MKKAVLLFFLLCTHSAQARIELVLPGDKPHPYLVELFTVLGLQHEGTASHMSQVASENLRRKGTQERWEMQEIYQEKRDQLMPILEKLGVLYEVHPSLSYYDYILIHGALVPRMRDRLRFLDELWGKGLRAKKIVFLTSERPLHQDLENNDVLFNKDHSSVLFREDWVQYPLSPQTEADGAKLAWDQVITHPSLRFKKVHYVVVPMIENKETGALRRAHTGDTVEAWLDTDPKIGKYLAISNNPYISYQDQIMRNILRKKGYLEQGATLETVGPSADISIPLAVHLDAVSQWLYREVDAFF